jgi:hypothetical protein
VLVIDDFFQNWSCFEFCNDVLIPSMFRKNVFCSFLRNFTFVAVILDLSGSFSVQVSLPYGRVGSAGVLCIHNMVCF